MGIGLSTFTEVVGAGPSKDFDILGIKMFDSCELRIHPTGKAIARFGTKSQGQGHETTYAQILAEELGIPAAHIQIEEGDTDTAPYGLGTYASRSTPTGVGSQSIRSRIGVTFLDLDMSSRNSQFFSKDLGVGCFVPLALRFGPETGNRLASGMDSQLTAVEHLDSQNIEILGRSCTYDFSESG